MLIGLGVHCLNQHPVFVARYASTDLYWDHRNLSVCPKFKNVNVSVHVSGAPLDSRLLNVRDLAYELWPWLTSRLAALEQDANTCHRTRLLLVTGRDAEAEQLASTLHELLQGSARSHGSGAARKLIDKSAYRLRTGSPTTISSNSPTAPVRMCN